jgi:hypothetical protein
VAADGQDSVLILDVYFDVRVVAFAVPRVLARVSHFRGSTFPCCARTAFFTDLRSLSQQHFTELGERSESERSLLVLWSAPGIVGALAPAIEASFHSAASALGVVEWSGSRSPVRSFSQGSGASKQMTAQRANKLLAAQNCLIEPNRK